MFLSMYFCLISVRTSILPVANVCQMSKFLIFIVCFFY